MLGDFRIDQLVAKRLEGFERTFFDDHRLGAIYPGVSVDQELGPINLLTTDLGVRVRLLSGAPNLNG
jgi:hypothetical protein